MSRRWRISEVAGMAHVTVRTLHHYDATGLLAPAERSESGYRLYSQSDLERLQQVLLYRELGFSLDAIRELLDQPAIDRRAALEAQRRLLVEKRRKTDAVIRAVDRTIEAMEGTEMSTEELFEGFEDLADAPADVREHHRKHAKEAIERWGETDAYEQSMRRARSYSKEQWRRIQAEGEENEARMAALLASGEAPDGERAMDGAEALRRHISRWFYDCGHDTHVGLADMYETDARFTEHYEKRAEGLASFVAGAIRANAARAGAPGNG